jgi:hypothetical protein
MPQRLALASINYWPLVYLVAMGVIGTALAYFYRRRQWAGPLAKLLAACVVGGTVLLHVLTLLILDVDPRRDITGIPLSAPLPMIAGGLLFVFFVPGLLWQGFLLGSLARPGRDGHSVLWKLTFIVAAVYSVWITPWAFEIIMD